MFRDENISNADKKATILDFDKVLGLGFENLKEAEKISIPEEILKLAEQRKLAKENKDFQKSDELRKEIDRLYYPIDVPSAIE